MGKFHASLLPLLGLWMLDVLIAGRTEAISTGLIHSGSLHIVHMEISFTADSRNDDDVSVDRRLHLYRQLLRLMRQEANTTISSAADAQPVHVYRHALHGFSAQLTEAEAEVLRSMEGVLGVHRDHVRQLQTTHTPEFLGLSDAHGLWPQAGYGEDVIVGVLDTGVWPESASYSDFGLGSVPARWKGHCQTGQDFLASSCNRKLIGARYYSGGYEVQFGSQNEIQESKSPRDTAGHGSHTSSTAAGAAVANASLLGFASGTARGMATKARIAMYKICWSFGCLDSDIAAAFDQAVADGVDVISLSVGGWSGSLLHDTIAIAAFGAMKKGISVSCSAGNGGPWPLTVNNAAPWVTTVAASTVDRTFPASVHLGDGKALPGVSLYWYAGQTEEKKFHDLVYGADVVLKHVKAADGALCSNGTLDPALVRGKIVLCMLGESGGAEKGEVVKEAGGFGMVVVYGRQTREALLADSYLLPATAVGANEGAVILHYINSTKLPVAKFAFGHHGGTVLNLKHSPAVAWFSSRGPNFLMRNVLKPDLTAPGVNILAAWSGQSSPSGLASDHRKVPFNIISGTSMSCPHVSGLGALLKSAHPHWSPAAIKSAMMTTASVVDNSNSGIADEATGKPADPFAYGSGHVRPELAASPGLVYDMGNEDYVLFLCAMGYSDSQIKIFTGEGTNCPVEGKPRVEDMNYPSFSAVYNVTDSTTLAPITFHRTVTNVGDANATYRATIVAPEEVSISVHPKELTFTEVNEKKEFTLTVVGTKRLVEEVASTTMFGSIQWSDGKHVVRSPIEASVLK